MVHQYDASLYNVPYYLQCIFWVRQSWKGGIIFWHMVENGARGKSMVSMVLTSLLLRCYSRLIHDHKVEPLICGWLQGSMSVLSINHQRQSTEQNSVYWPHTTRQKSLTGFTHLFLIRQLTQQTYKSLSASQLTIKPWFHVKMKFLKRILKYFSVLF